MKPSEFSSPAKSFWTAENCRQFAQLCESTLNEVSTAFDLMKRLPGADVLLKSLHKEHSLPHDVEWQSVKKPNWGLLKKEAYPRSPSWILFAGPGGSAAASIDSNTSSYSVVGAQAGGEGTETYDISRGDEVMAVVAEIIGGRPTSIWQAVTNRDLYNKRQERRARRSKTDEPGSRALDSTELAEKFRPLMQRAIRAAIADIQGFAIMQIKNNNRAGAARKLARMDRLEAMSDELESRRSMPSSLVSIVSNAVHMAAAYYYPEMTGELANSYNYGQDHFRVSAPADRAGVEQLLKDLHAGNTEKLGTVLAFFKRSLLA
jgi:hypothetical protein